MRDSGGLGQCCRFGENLGLPVLDTTRIHVEAALNYALEGN